MKIALKGNIGSGKTTVSKYLSEKYHYYHFNCDEQVANMYMSNDELIARVNKEILNCHNSIVNKNDLKKIVFSDEKKLRELERIVYPYLENILSGISAQNIVFDCQQIEKLKIDIDVRIYIEIDKKIEVGRVMKRDNRLESEVNSIIDIQNNEIKKYDFIISNSGNLDELYEQIDEVIRSIRG